MASVTNNQFWCVNDQLKNENIVSESMKRMGLNSMLLVAYKHFLTCEVSLEV